MSEMKERETEIERERESKVAKENNEQVEDRGGENTLRVSKKRRDNEVSLLRWGAIWA